MLRPGLILFLSLIATNIYAQDVRYIDSLKKAFSQSQEDTNKVNLYVALSWEYQWSFPDTALTYAIPGLQLARKLNFENGEILILNSMGEAFSQKGNYPKALETQFKALELSEKINDSVSIGRSISFIGGVFFYSGDYQKALFYYNKQKLYNASFKFPKELVFGHLGETYFHLNKLDSAFLYTLQAYELCLKNNFLWPVPAFYLGAIYAQKGKYPLALGFYKKGISISTDQVDFIDGDIGMSTVFRKMNLLDSAIHYAREAVTLAQKTALSAQLVQACTILIEIYKNNDATDSSFKYMEIAMAAKDNLFAQSKQNLAFNEQLHQQELDNEKKLLENKLKTYVFIGILIAFTLIGIFLWRNNRHKQKAYVVLQKQKQETDLQKVKVEQTLEELKTTQAQLIQSEKMASLGELTAGIAHEIQNPLNFVNNFSEVNSELIVEMNDELDKGNIKEAKSIISDLQQNLEKINHHGKRADSIVKGMLQHSQISTGQKELTNINALADEYLRLSYHGMRAKDKEFNATIKTDFDDAIGKINIIPQDIGRVLLNLYNNAFYALAEKKKLQGGDFKPTISVSTKRLNDKVEIRVKDNGNGIPRKIVDKIFQPFFTTKPTGEGTGLGLSLSYDIIKAHGGEIKAETREGEGSEFIILLPLKESM